MANTLSGKVIVVTGAGSGIGRASALLLAREGAKLVVADVNAAQGQATVHAITDGGGEAIFVRVNVAVEAEVEQMVKTAVDTFGRLDGAFNNAGVGTAANLVGDTPLDEWNRVIGINLTGVFLCVKHEVNAMAKSGGGAIVNMSSIAGIKGVPAQVAYSASKHGVIGITRTAAAEYARAGIRVNAVCPGVVNTEANRAADVDWNEVVPTPMGRIADPAEVGELVAWLLSEKASYVTGQPFAIDGGMSTTTFILPAD